MGEQGASLQLLPRAEVEDHVQITPAKRNLPACSDADMLSGFTEKILFNYGLPNISQH